MTVVPAVNQLEAGAISLTPFEVVSSTRRADVVAASWRYIQFEYGVRMLADGFFGQDGQPPHARIARAGSKWPRAARSFSMRSGI